MARKHADDPNPPEEEARRYEPTDPLAIERALLHIGGRAGEWGSLGRWPLPQPSSSLVLASTTHIQTADYFGACAALADAVLSAAGPFTRGRVWVPGCGTGAELLHWAAQRPGVRWQGLEQRAALVAVARQAELEVTQGDAAKLPSPSEAGRFDAVLCVDAAYHFNPRSRWLAAAHARLKPGGTLVFTDLYAHRSWQAPLLNGLLRPAQVAGLTTLERSRNRLVKAGFAVLDTQPLDEAVLGGFVRFVALQSKRIDVAAKKEGFGRVLATARLIPLARTMGMGYALFSAKRQ